MKDVVCPNYGSATVTESVRNLTSNVLVLAVKNIDCYDWSNTGNPSQITGRVVDAGETATYRLEQASRARYDLGVFVRDGSGLRRVGKLSAYRNGNGHVDHPGSLLAVPGRVLTTNTGQSIHPDADCAQQLLGEDPKRSESTVSFDPEEGDVTTIYSDGTNLYGVRCLTRVARFFR